VRQRIRRQSSSVTCIISLSVSRLSTRHSRELRWVFRRADDRRQGFDGSTFNACDPIMIACRFFPSVLSLQGEGMSLLVDALLIGSYWNPVMVHLVSEATEARLRHVKDGTGYLTMSKARLHRMACMDGRKETMRTNNMQLKTWNQSLIQCARLPRTLAFVCN
jgi:hypothetical protein